MTLYALKSHFQDWLRPLVTLLSRCSVTANQITVAAALGSVFVGAVTTWLGDRRWVFLFIPVWLFVRMALNAIDGMLAREFDQKSVLGAYLNEMGDVVSDAALYVPFAFIAPFGPLGIGLVMMLATMTELAGVLGLSIGASRRYDGPMGKSDRAVVFGALGLWVGASAPIPVWFGSIVPTVAVLLVLTVVNRIRAGIAEVETAASLPC